MIALTFTNIPDAGTRYFDTIEDAVAAGKAAGFEFTVWGEDGERAASWAVFGGLRAWA